MAKILGKHKLKEKRLYFGSRLQRMQSMVCWLHCFGSEIRPNIMAGEYDRRKLLNSQQPGSTAIWGRRGQEDQPFQSICPVTCFLHQGPISNGPLRHQWINLLTRSDLSCPINSPKCQPSTHETLGDITDLNHNNLLCSHVLHNDISVKNT